MLVSVECATSNKTYNKNAHKYREDYYSRCQQKLLLTPINFIKGKPFIMNVLPRCSKYEKQYQLQNCGIHVQFITNM